MYGQSEPLDCMPSLHITQLTESSMHVQSEAQKHVLNLNFTLLKACQTKHKQDNSALTEQDDMLHPVLGWHSVVLGPTQSGPCTIHI